MTRSTSAPARKVRRMPPNPERNVSQGVEEILRKFPPITPRVISIRATEIPVSTEMRLPKKTNNPMIKAIY
jgi:hypothetical protein